MSKAKIENKYLRLIRSATQPDAAVHADVYEVLAAFSVICPARQHAIKKLLCAGIRGKGNEEQDLREAGESIARAIQMAASPIGAK